MSELNIFEKIIYYIKSLFKSKKKTAEISDELKKEMCKNAIQGGVCPHACDICAWNTLSGCRLLHQAVLAIAGDSCLDLDSYEDTREFCDKIKELPSVTPQPLKWIPVSERLPEKTSKYIVTIGINRFGFGMYDEVSIATYNIKSGWFCVEDNKDTVIGEVIAWMPLPAPYKAEREE